LERRQNQLNCLSVFAGEDQFGFLNFLNSISIGFQIY